MSKNAYEIVTNQIIEQLEHGVVLWRKTWRGTGGLPKNAMNGREYRGINVMLLATSPYASPHWALAAA